MEDLPRRSKAPEFQPPPWEALTSPEVPLQEPGEEQKPVVIPPIPQPAAEPGTKSQRATVESEQLEGMLVQLSIEETDSGREFRTVSLLSALFLAAVGLMMMVWGVVATVRTAQAGVAGATGGLILIVFGGGFMGIAAWTAVRYTKRRGER